VRSSGVGSAAMRFSAALACSGSAVAVGVDQLSELDSRNSRGGRRAGWPGWRSPGGPPISRSTGSALRADLVWVLGLPRQRDAVVGQRARPEGNPAAGTDRAVRLQLTAVGVTISHRAQVPVPAVTHRCRLSLLIISTSNQP
jgi:hypothetical protein